MHLLPVPSLVGNVRTVVCAVPLVFFIVRKVLVGLMKRVATIIVVGIAMLLPGTAFAASSSTCQNYSPQLCSVASNVASQTTGTGSSASTSQNTLPFTGLDVVLLAAGGGVLLGAGLVVRRLSSGTSD